MEVSRPHPLHLDRPRTASAELSGFTHSEKALHLDAAFARSVGHLDWSIFAGLTADVELQATPEAETVSFKAGGLQVAAGVRVYF